MKLSPVVVLVTSFMMPAVCQAEVLLQLGEGVELHAVDGKMYRSQGIFTGDTSLKLDDGLHQIVVGYKAEIGRNRDDRVVESSDAFVILFEAEETTLTLSAPDITTRRKLSDFNDDPQWRLKDDTGNDLEFQVDILEKEGFQLVRDYEEELSDFNRSQSVAALGVTAPAGGTDASHTESMPSGDSADDQGMVRQMLRYWYLKADETTKNEMKRWIRSGE